MDGSHIVFHSPIQMLLMDVYGYVVPCTTPRVHHVIWLEILEEAVAFTSARVVIASFKINSWYVLST